MASLLVIDDEQEVNDYLKEFFQGHGVEEHEGRARRQVSWSLKQGFGICPGESEKKSDGWE